MDLHLFDLNLLVALDALLTERNVTRAGNRLNLSQSAMSGRWLGCRHYFRDELLVPVGRQMVLTPVAEGLVGPVRDILLQIRGTLGSKPSFDPSYRHAPSVAGRQRLRDGNPHGRRAADRAAARRRTSRSSCGRWAVAPARTSRAASSTS
jgi:hypothetical protein